MKNLFKLSRAMRSIAIIALAAVIGFSMTACPEDDGGRDLPPEEKPVQDRWNKYVAEDSTATLEYEVDADGVCKITVGGTSDTNFAWKTTARYNYTGKANTIYTYEFEAWTESGTRNAFYIGYYEDNDESVYLGTSVGELTTTKKTYKINGVFLPKGGVHFLNFHCGGQLGTFYVKILSIKEVGTVKSITITGIPEGYDGAIIDLFSGVEGRDEWIDGEGEISGGSVTIPLMTYEHGMETPFIESGEFYVTLFIYGESSGKHYVYANGTTLPDGFTDDFDWDKLPKVSITDAVTTIAFNKFADVTDYL
jgi:hypothetical protein